MDQASSLPDSPVTPADTYESLARLIDYHLLEPELSDDQIAEACRIAREYAVRALIVRPADVDNALRWIESNEIVVGSTVGYPDGSTTTGAKLYEGRDLLRRGVRELEMVVNVGKLVSRQFQYVEMELLQMAKSCHESGARLTVLLRNDLLAADLQIIATKIAKRIEADTLSVVPAAGEFERIKPLLKDRIGLKAESQASTLDHVLALRQWGCAQVGCRQAEAVLRAWRAHLAQASRDRESGPAAVS